MFWRKCFSWLIISASNLENWNSWPLAPPEAANWPLCASRPQRDNIWSPEIKNEIQDFGMAKILAISLLPFWTSQETKIKPNRFEDSSRRTWDLLHFISSFKNPKKLDEKQRSAKSSSLEVFFYHFLLRFDQPTGERRWKCPLFFNSLSNCKKYSNFVF